MDRRKQLALDALKCPVRRALQTCWAEARQCAWRQTTANALVFDPDSAVDRMRELLGVCVCKGVLCYWELEVQEGWLCNDWTLKLRFTFQQNGTRTTGTEKFRVR